MRLCHYWQSILTLLMLGCALVVVIAISVFFMGGGMRGVVRDDSDEERILDS